MYVINNMKVKNIIISKQPEDSVNFQEFLRIVNGKNINVVVVDKGDKIVIDKDLYFDILWPDSNDFIDENALNNNSIVCKLVYGNFSMLFTADIEEIAEKEILRLYSNNKNVLSSTILKVAHHGSKSSTIQEFLENVNPQIALIGVGRNNNFGHPNSEVIKKLENLRC